MTSLRLARWTAAVVMATAALGVLADGAYAAWSASGSGSGGGVAASVNAGGAPAAAVAGSTVGLTWAAATLSNGPPVTGYVIKRYDVTGLTEQTISAGTCASTVAGTSCSETAVPTGVWRYSITPTVNNWRGAESSQTSVTVDTTPPPAPTFSSTPANPTSSSSASFSFTSAETGVSFQCRLDGAAFSTCTSPTSYAGLTDGSHTFQVKAVDAATNQSAATSYPWVVDTTAPTVAVNFTAAGAFYNNAGFNGGCSTPSGDFCGTAADAGTGLSTVKVSIRRGAGSYWNGTAFASASEVLLNATGGGTWSQAFAAANFPAGGSYTLRAVVTDNAGNTSSATTTFTMDNTAPAATDIQTSNQGSTAGRAEQGDTISYTFSEPVNPASILAGWNGTSTPVVVRIANNASNDRLTIRNATNTAQLNLGSVDLLGNYVSGTVAFGATGTPSTMVMTGNTITVTLGTPNIPSRILTVAVTGWMPWTPSGSATDRAGNPCSGTPVTESGPQDLEF
jgi:Big-like domain-containing protein